MKKRLGFGCAWWWPREPTWSYTPVNLVRALGRCADDVVTLDIQPPLAVKAALAAVYRASELPWQIGGLNRALNARALRRKARSASCDVVITIADSTYDAGVPTYAYQDMNFQAALALCGQLDESLVASRSLTTRNGLERLARWQNQQYGRLAGVLAMSNWFREQLIDQGVAADRVKVVGAGITSALRELHEDRSESERTRLLFVGGDFARKAGHEVLEAVRILRSAGDRPLTLTVVGPRRWPDARDHPDWVTFLGAQHPSRVAALWAKHDLLVMPSRLEPYGIVFLEAQAAAVPCIARRAFAMAELVPEGRGGVLVDWEAGVPEIAAAIDSALGDDDLYDAVRRRAHEVRREHSWDAVACRILGVIGEV